MNEASLAHTKDNITSRLRLSDLIGRYVKTTKAGREFKACCPFHNEKTPSFTINDDKGFYHCFGCGKHGDHFDFVMEYQNLEFKDALTILAEMAGVELPKFDPKAKEKQDQTATYHDILDKACNFCEEQLRLPKNSDILEYLHGRGMSDELIKNFRIGFAPSAQEYQNFFDQNKFKAADLLATGLLKQNEDGTRTYPFFRDRVTFPVIDRRGKVIAFGGRILPDNIRPAPQTSFTPPKYMNSNDTAVFHKGSVLYNENHARKAVSDDEDLIVAEGYVDVIALASAGFKGAVAPMGTALTEQQIQTLWAMIPSRDKVKEPILCFDGDSAGLKAALRSLERILPLIEGGVGMRFAFLPQGQDPDDLIRTQGRSAMQEILKSAIPLSEMVWISQTYGRDISTPEAKAHLKKALNHLIYQINDESLRQIYAQDIQNRLFSLNKTSQKKFRNPSKKGGSNTDFDMRPAKTLLSHKMKTVTCRIILASLLNHPSIYEDIAEDISAYPFIDQGLDDIRQQIIKTIYRNPDINSERLITQIKERSGSSALEEILNKNTYLHAGFAEPDAQLPDVLNGLKQVLKKR